VEVSLFSVLLDLISRRNLGLSIGDIYGWLIWDDLLSDKDDCGSCISLDKDFYLISLCNILIIASQSTRLFKRRDHVFSRNHKLGLRKSIGCFLLMWDTSFSRLLNHCEIAVFSSHAILVRLILLRQRSAFLRLGKGLLNARNHSLESDDLCDHLTLRE
jgi:hypothetical protein